MIQHLRLKQFAIIVFALLGLVHIALSAPVPNPVLMLQSISNRLLANLKTQRSQHKTKISDEWIYQLVKRIVIPHVDLVRTSRAVLGRNMWISSNPSQRRAFADAFTRTVIKTYASALDAYTDETIRFFPIRGNYQNRRTILVRSQVLRPDSPPIPLDYRLIFLKAKNAWKIYDLSVEGISLIQSFRSQFSSEFSKGKTIGQLTADLKRRN
jgi:phospholipid transport system substrate-binding protein